MTADENTLGTFIVARPTPTWRTRLRVAERAAAIVAALRKPREEFEPDPFATEMPFLEDSWPHS